MSLNSYDHCFVGLLISHRVNLQLVCHVVKPALCTLQKWRLRFIYIRQNSHNKIKAPYPAPPARCQNTEWEQSLHLNRCGQNQLSNDREAALENMPLTGIGQHKAGSVSVPQLSGAI